MLWFRSMAETITRPTIMRQVQKPFEGPDGRHYATGELVDASGWRWVTLLEDQRYLSGPIVLPDAPSVSPTRAMQAKKVNDA